MKKVVIASVMFLLLSTPSYAWWDSYGGFTCGYMDPLTSFLDNIFGPPCPAPVIIQQVPVPVPVAVPVPQPVPVPVPQPVPVPVPYYGGW